MIWVHWTARWAYKQSAWCHHYWTNGRKLLCIFFRRFRNFFPKRVELVNMQCALKLGMDHNILMATLVKNYWPNYSNLYNKTVSAKFVIIRLLKHSKERYPQQAWSEATRTGDWISSYYSNTFIIFPHIPMIYIIVTINDIYMNSPYEVNVVVIIWIIETKWFQNTFLNKKYYDKLIHSNFAMYKYLTFFSYHWFRIWPLGKS